MKTAKVVTGLKISEMPITNDYVVFRETLTPLTQIPVEGGMLHCDEEITEKLVPVHTLFGGDYGRYPNGTYIAYSPEVVRYLKLPHDALSERAFAAEHEASRMRQHNQDYRSQVFNAKWTQRLWYLFTGRLLTHPPEEQG